MAQWWGWGHEDPPGWNRVSIRESKSSAQHGVGLWIRLCSRELLKAYRAEVCREKGYAGQIEEAKHAQRWTITQVQVGNGKGLK